MKIVAPAQIREPEDLQFLSTAHRARKELEIDLSEVTWISPLGVVAVLASCLRADEASLDATVYLPDSHATHSYLSQIGFLKELEQHDWTVPDDSEASPSDEIGPHLAVSRLTTEIEVDLAADLLTEALREAGLSGGLADDLHTIAAELTANAREHGEECYAVAQTHTGQSSGTPGVHIAVADFGPGFARTLERRYGKMKDSEAIFRGFEEHVSGTGKTGRGHGLGYVAEAIDKHPENVLHIVSRSAHVLRQGGQLKVGESLAFGGTWASAYLPVSPTSL